MVDRVGTPTQHVADFVVGFYPGGEELLAPMPIEQRRFRNRTVDLNPRTMVSISSGCV
jgi:hypothetical protein